MYRNRIEKPKALADSFEASADDPQQWYREGAAGICMALLVYMPFDINMHMKSYFGLEVFLTRI